jgi:hypothetical protein
MQTPRDARRGRVTVLAASQSLPGWQPRSDVDMA